MTERPRRVAGVSTLLAMPRSVLLAGAVANAVQLVLLAVSSFNPPALVGLGMTVVAAVLLAVGNLLGWILMMLWAISIVSAPFLYGSSIWLVLPGAVTLSALVANPARKHFFPGSKATRPSSPVTQTGIGPGSDYRDVVAEAPYRLQRLIEGQRYVVRLHRRKIFWMFLGATVVLLPLTGIMTRLKRGSGRGDLLVDIAYHFISVCSTLAILGLVLMVFSIARNSVR